MSEDVLPSTIRCGAKVGRNIKGHERDEGPVLWKCPHLLDLSYAELEEKNLEVRAERLKGVTSDQMRDKFMKYLADENGIKAVTVCFSDLEGRLHALDYDRKHILTSEDNLTFDGSSIHGFTELSQSDLRLKIDWTSVRWLPSDIFGSGKMMAFANVCDRDNSYYISDFRSNLALLCEDLKKKGISVFVAPEIEGFLFDDKKAEQKFDEKAGFRLATMSGYFNSLPQDSLRLFIDKFAEAQRALGFCNEKDHPEVAPAQFELNFRYSLSIDCADQILLYKLLARQIARSMGFTACFLPKPIQNLNGSGMHTNISLAKDGRNIFYKKGGKYNISDEAWKFIAGVLFYANDLCLAMNSSVNAYRRLDPNFEAPNQIVVSEVNRGAMIRIPEGNENSARLEVRTVAPDANPYLFIYAVLQAGLKGMNAGAAELKKMEAKVYNGRKRILPANIYEALKHFRKSEFNREILGSENVRKYAEIKERTADRCAKAFGHMVKAPEVLYHHEVTNQLLWDEF